MCCATPNGGSACRPTNCWACPERLTLLLAHPPFVAGEGGAVARRERDRGQPDLRAGEAVAVGDRDQAAPELAHPVGGELAELALGDCQRLLPDPRGGLAEAELGIARGEAIIGPRRIEVEL